MKSISQGILMVVILVNVFACTHTGKDGDRQEGTAHVAIRKDDNGYHMYINDTLFEIKGVGMGNDQFRLLKQSGGNALRTWSTRNGLQVLDSAKKYGLMVAMGLSMGQELHGFDYGDSVAVAEQFESIKKSVNELKDHPNLLCWVAGNELNLRTDNQLVNPKTYTALKEVVDYIHENDPHHPVTTAFAGASKAHIDLALEYCPDLDFLSYQMYGGLGAIPAIVKEAGITKPYAVTEYGPVGHWEMPKTEWGREIEEPSGAKAKGIYERMKKGLDNDQCLGGFAFLWGQKQERTPTWYGMFLKTGEATATVDELTRYWKGEYPENRAPNVDSMKIDDKSAVDNIYLKPGEKFEAQVFVIDPEGDDLTFQWDLLREVQERSHGGAYEKEPENVGIEIISDKNGTLKFMTPVEPGEYRLFSYVYDGHGKAGTANVPFYIK